jgi:DNA topoisomerase-1
MKGGLVYVSDADPGISRRRYGNGFRYYDPSSRAIKPKAEVARIDQLAVPPAYKGVWICTRPDGHIQATGLDAAGRKQYRYHPDWTTSRGAAKFERLAEFGRSLPKVRRKVAGILANTKSNDIFGKEVAIAALVRLLDQTAMRIGGRSKSSQGATTLMTRHISYGDGSLRLRYTAKGGKKTQASITDRKLQRTLEKIHELPGKRLFQYIGTDGQIHPLDSGDVNGWLKEITGLDDISAKMFRTWHGSVAALEAVRCANPPSVKIACEAAADVLCNTPAISRKSYVHPDILKLVESGALANKTASPPSIRGLAAPERRLISILT